MKNTYLIYKQVDGTRQLVKATQDEWTAILKANKKLPPNQRRRFEMDCCEDGEGFDRMYIEVLPAEHSEWNSKHTMAERNRKEGNLYAHLSLDAPVQDTEVESLHEAISCGFDLEAVAIDRVLMEELETALKSWKPWANELLKLYLEGKGRSCTISLSEKYHITDRAIQKRKTAFEKFVVDFLKK